MSPNVKTKEKGRLGCYEAALIKLGEEKVLYVTIPYKGCTKIPRCLFCGVQEQCDKNLKIDRKFGSEVLLKIKKYLNRYLPDSLVLYNGGNILREEEMFQETVLVDIPEYIASHSRCNVYEIEVRVDDIILFQKKLKTIQSHLKTKKFRLRVGIEFFNNELLKRHKKGNTISQIKRAVAILNKLGIEWNGYLMFGGLDMKKKEAISAVIKGGKFMINNNAYKISLNGIFLTDKMQQIFRNRIFVPDYPDLISVIRELFKYKKEKKSLVLFKVGFIEENTENVVIFPYISKKTKLKKIVKKLDSFNITQNIQSLLISN